MIAITSRPVQPNLLHPGHTRALDQLSQVSPAHALRRAAALVARLADELIDLFALEDFPANPPDQQGGPLVARHFEGHAGSWWLGLFVWPPGATTPIHDHTSWGVYRCAAGTLLEERYRRLDDGAQPNHARLRLAWRRRWNRDDSSALLPYAGGIHRITNLGDTPAWSVHLYGPRVGPFDGRDYDPAHDAVCDRAA